ncbi:MULTISPECIES: hypothetical protein [unclassified Nocardioides]|uniref:hypothetical protein n=1 Tax=unclassified Nocardioides TaxID=2615069 RepID=UPI0009F13AE8|nr:MULTISPECIES: hypothetical protein [unclassified Nocardioides]GAW50766.1 uncharacterized protein PD653B2_3102 [Nocardioides sp. PD653-B2]GAW55505.1 uncharacterized protein PD653_2930 [Nocardioides sp. PD653]
MTAPFDADDELRARLRASDPAASLPPADPTRVARLLEDVMSTELTTENRETGTHDRGPLTWLVAAAAVLIIAGVGLFGVLSHDDDPAAPPTAVDDKTVTELSAPGVAAYNAKCMVPNAEIVSQQTLAFDGTVTMLADGVVTLAPSHWYAGAETDLVRVQAPAQDMQQLVGAVEFEEGGRYLVSATDGQVTVCGFSAPYSADLAAVYAEAFPG